MDTNIGIKPQSKALKVALDTVSNMGKPALRWEQAMDDVPSDNFIICTVGPYELYVSLFPDGNGGGSYAWGCTMTMPDELDSEMIEGGTCTTITEAQIAAENWLQGIWIAITDKFGEALEA